TGNEGFSVVCGEFDPPVVGGQACNGVELVELVLPCAADPAVVHRSGFRGLSLAHECDDGDGRLDGEDVVFLTRASPLSAEVEDPDIAGDVYSQLAQPHEGGSVDPRRGRDERDDRTFLLVLFENLPDRPAPEVD